MRLSVIRRFFSGKAGKNSGASRLASKNLFQKNEAICQEGSSFFQRPISSPSSINGHGTHFPCFSSKPIDLDLSSHSPFNNLKQNSFYASDVALPMKHVESLTVETSPFCKIQKEYFTSGPDSLVKKDSDYTSSAAESLSINSDGSPAYWQQRQRIWEDDAAGDVSLTTPLPAQSIASSSSLKDRATLNSDRSHLWHRPRGEEQRFNDVNHNAAASLPPVAATSSEVQREYYIPVQAYYIARSLDFKGLLDGPFKKYLLHVVRNNVIFRFPDRTNGPAPGASGMGSVPFMSERYMVAFQYGSVVFLNFESREQERALEDLRPFCSGHFTEARKDDYGIVLRPTLAGWSEGGHDHIMVNQLDISNIRVITSVLGQSVALEFYAKKVDEMVTTFSDLNRGMEKTGTFTMKRKKLFQLVATANTTLADVILRLGLLERSDTAWKHARYAKIWEYLRDDFELDERFESLDFKLNIIQHNVRFFLDILQNRKSDTLEWIIILLIAGEICVSLYEIISTAMKTSQANMQTAISSIDSIGLAEDSTSDV